MLRGGYRLEGFAFRTGTTKLLQNRQARRRPISNNGQHQQRDSDRRAEIEGICAQGTHAAKTRPTPPHIKHEPMKTSGGGGRAGRDREGVLSGQGSTAFKSRIRHWKPRKPHHRCPPEEKEQTEWRTESSQGTCHRLSSTKIPAIHQPRPCARASHRRTPPPPPLTPPPPPRPRNRPPPRGPPTPPKMSPCD